MAKWTTGQLSMFSPTTSEGSSSATSSPASADGVTRSDSRDGQTTEPYGPEAVPVSRGAWRDRAKVPTIRAIFGQPGSGSLRSHALQSSLENRLRARMASIGSTLFTLTWKRWATPSGRSICALRASAHRTSGSASGSWPTPMAGSPATETYNEAGDTCNSRKTRLLVAWSTPRANKWGFPDAHGSKEIPMATWPTPTREDSEATGLRPATTVRPASHTLTSASRLASWGTPTHQDSKHATVSPSEMKRDPRNLRIQVTGAVPTGSPAPTANGGQLNPAHSRWLMGYPPEWDVCAVTAMPSSRRSRRK